MFLKIVRYQDGKERVSYYSASQLNTLVTIIEESKIWDYPMREFAIQSKPFENVLDFQYLRML